MNDKVQSLFQQALSLDSADARVWAGLSRVYRNKVWQSDSLQKENSEKSLYMGEKAVMLDDASAEAHFELAEILRVRWVWQRALKETEKGLQLNPDVGSTRIYLTLGQMQKQLKFDLEAMERDPAGANRWRNLGLTHLYMGNFTEARKCFEKVLLISPTYEGIRDYMGDILVKEGRYREAIEEYNKADIDEVGLAIAYALLGDSKKSAEHLAKLPLNRLYFRLARIHAMTGKIDKAFTALDSAYARRSPNFVFFKTDPLLTNLRKDPRYTAFLKKLNLPE